MAATGVNVVAPSTTIATDLVCTNCGYNLRTLGAEARCPECGAAVADSVAAAKVGPTDYRSLAWGAWLLGACGAATVVASIAEVAAVRWLGMSWDASRDKVQLATVLLIPPMLLVGVILLVRSRRFRFARRRAALTVIVEAILLALLMVLDVAGEAFYLRLRLWGVSQRATTWLNGAELAAAMMIAGALVYWGMAYVVRLCRPGHRWWVAACAAVTGVLPLVFMATMMVQHVRAMLGYNFFWKTGHAIQEWLSVYMQTGPGTMQLVPVWDRVPFALFWVVAGAVAWRKRRRRAE